MPFNFSEFMRNYEICEMIASIKWEICGILFGDVPNKMCFSYSVQGELLFLFAFLFLDIFISSITFRYDFSDGEVWNIESISTGII